MKVANESRPQKNYTCTSAITTPEDKTLFLVKLITCTRKKWKFYFQNKILITVVIYQTVKPTTIP